MLRALTALLLAGFVAACSKHGAGSGGGGHAHTAPHGGTLVELGQHAYALELVRDAATGKLSAFILDGHAENFIRLKAPSFTLVATVGGEKRPLTFQPVANPATGETVGDTSQYDAQADWLKTTAAFEGTIHALEIRGSKFEHIAIRFPGGGH